MAAILARRITVWVITSKPYNKDNILHCLFSLEKIVKYQKVAVLRIIATQQKIMKMLNFIYCQKIKKGVNYGWMQLDRNIQIRMEILITNAFGHPSHFMFMLVQSISSLVSLLWQIFKIICMQVSYLLI